MSCELGGQSPKVGRNNLLASRHSNGLPLLVVASRKNKNHSTCVACCHHKQDKTQYSPLQLLRKNNQPVSWVVGFQKQGNNLPARAKFSYLCLQL